jgi:hypothetical protein
MKTQMTTRLFALLLLGYILLPSLATAQDAGNSGTEHRYWLGIGVGLGVLPGAEDQDVAESVAGALTATYQVGPNLITARTAVTNELFRDSVYDIGLLYGRVLSDDAVFAAVGMGVAFVDGTRSEGVFGDPKPMDATIGLPLDVQLFVRLSRYVSVGLYGFANVNPEESFLGATVIIQAGIF